MKPYKPFAVRDRFKGFEEPEELKGVKDEFYADAYKQMTERIRKNSLITTGLTDRLDAARYFFMDPIIEIQDNYVNELYRSLYYGESRGGRGAMLPNGITLGEPIFYEMNPELQPCEHKPIDIGFATPKMICKKCDKDLK